MATNDSKAILDGVIDYLEESGKEELLPQVARAFEDMAESAGFATEIEVFSAVELTAAQKKQIQELVKNQQGIDLPLTNTVNQILIGGLIIRVGDWVFDGSVKTELEKMKQTLLS